MNKYRVWCPDLEDEEGAETITSYSWTGAAKEYAEISYRDDPFDEMIVRVKDPDGTTFSVTVEAMPSVDFFVTREP